MLRSTSNSCRKEVIQSVSLILHAEEQLLLYKTMTLANRSAGGLPAKFAKVKVSDVRQLKVLQIQLITKQKPVPLFFWGLIYEKNNLVIFGIPQEHDLTSAIENIAKDTLEVDLEDADMNDLYRIGIGSPNKQRAVILELVRYVEKSELFKNERKLKNSEISITHDLGKKEREEQKLLVKHLNQAKRKQYQAKIIRNKLVVDGEEYTYEQLTVIEEDEAMGECEVLEDKVITIKSQSVPNTPSNSMPTNKIMEEKEINKGGNISSPATNNKIPYTYFQIAETRTQ
ncbi:unnamed protein product [Phaedon cochleariae]|uniref:Uncharacterized protein n=1 Tax=Phaedon cochleariae TaxID=80249 RepID=A0A9N9X2Q2_PHACE|nr:unnamed protein product [Phaedon cochleariae]